MSLFLKVRFTNSQWLGQQDYNPGYRYVTLGVERDTATDGSIAEVLGEEDYVADRLAREPILRRVTCKFLTGHDDEWFARCDLEGV